MTTKAGTKWDVPPRRGTYDYLLKDIRDEVEKITPPPPPREPSREPPRPSRITVQIEITEQRRAPVSKLRLLRLLLIAFIVTLLLQALAHAETWTSYREGFMTRYQGSDGSTGTSYKQGFTTYFDMTLPDGTTKHCRSWQQSWQTVTQCD